MSHHTPRDHRSIAAWLLALRSGVGRSWRSAVVLATIFGVAAGFAVAALTTADQVESSYEKLLVDTDAPDLVAACFTCDRPEDVAAFLQGLHDEPAISDVGLLLQMSPILYTADGVLLGPFEHECGTGSGELGASTSWARGDTPPVRMINGRLPAPGSANEIALPIVTAERAGIEVGDQLFVTGACDGEGSSFKPKPLTVVGIFVGFLDVRPPGQAEYFEIVLVDAAFGDSIGVEPRPGGALIWYEAGSGADDLGDEARSSIFIDMTDHTRLITDRLRPDATALRILAALGVLAAIAVLGQLLARHLRLLGSDHTTLRALGTTRSDLWLLGVGHGALIGLAAGALTTVVAIGCLPFAPTGSGEDILRGTERGIPAVALGLGVVTTVAVVVLLSFAPAWLAARADRRGGSSASRSVASRLVGDGRLGITPSWGVRVALEPSGGPQPVPVRSGLGAAILATAVVAGVITFAAGLEHLRETPRLVGWNWDFIAGGDELDLDELAHFAEEHPGIERSSLGTIFPSRISLGSGIDFEVRDYAFDTGPNAVTPSVMVGRAPQGADELLLSAGVAEQLDLDVGDEVAVLAEDSFAFLHDALGVERDFPDLRETPFEVVGIGVLPVEDGRLDDAVSITLDGLRRIFEPVPRDEVVRLLLTADPSQLEQMLLDNELYELAAEITEALPDNTASVIKGWTDQQLEPLNPTREAQVLFVDIADDADHAAVVADFAESGLLNENSLVIGVLPDGTRIPAPELVALDLNDVAWIPSGMGILMGLTTLAVLAHLIATGARARRRDIATLRALGLAGRQARAIVAWQAVTLVLVTAAIALPVGVAAGRYAWHIYAEGLSVVPEPVTPWALLAVLLVGLIVAHLLASLLPGRSAARVRPINSLRSE